MSYKLEEGKYPDRFTFQSDFRLMMTNAKEYNAPGSFAHNEAIALETFFEKRMSMFDIFTQAILLIIYRRVDHYQ